jgi:hypothetical protein
MKSYLELIRDRAAEVEIPDGAVIVASTDVVRALISKFRERGEEVYHELDTNVYIFDGIPIEPSGELPKCTFVILARGGHPQ